MGLEAVKEGGSWSGSVYKRKYSMRFICNIISYCSPYRSSEKTECVHGDIFPFSYLTHSVEIWLKDVPQIVNEHFVLANGHGLC